MLSPLSVDLINWTYLAAINLNLTLKRISLPVPCWIPCRKSSPSCNSIITDVLVFEICLLQDHNCSQGRDYVCHALHNRLRALNVVWFDWRMLPSMKKKELELYLHINVSLSAPFTVYSTDRPFGPQLREQQPWKDFYYLKNMQSGGAENMSLIAPRN